ncbi:MAG: CHASE4 domain-containing protein [Candidatus Margulisiibacteriota bacterium]
MNFRLKLLLAIIVTFIFFFFASDQIGKKLIFGNFDKLERDYAISDMGRVLYFINDSFTSYDDTCRDWAYWDDTYAFVRDKNEKYRRSNLTPQTFDNLRIHLLMMFDEKGRVVYASGYNNSADTLQPLGSAAEKALIAGFTCKVINKGSQGVIMMPEGAMLVNARPIIQSSQTGPIRGTLVMGRYFDAFRLRRLTSVTHLYAQAYSLNQENIPADVKAALPALASSPIKLDNHKQTMVGYLLMNDVFRRPALVFRIEMPRTLYFQSQMFSSLLSIIRLSAFFFTGLVTLLILQPLVIAPIDRVNKELNQIMDHCNLMQGAKLAAPTDKDELATLQTSVDNMLKELERRHQPDRDPEP